LAKHNFYLKADWPGGRNSVGHIDAGNLKTQVSIPQEMDGPGVGTNPDEMLLGASATCYIITLAAMLERSSVDVKELTLESEAVIDVTDGVYTYEKIIHRPKIVLEHPEDEINCRTTRRLAEKAEESCMISKAIKGNVELEVHVSIH